MKVECEHGLDTRLPCGDCQKAREAGNAPSSVQSTALFEIIDRLVARRLTQREWAENAADQGMSDWAAHYGSVADAFTEAIDMLDVLISNATHDGRAIGRTSDGIVGTGGQDAN